MLEKITGKNQLARQWRGDGRRAVIVVKEEEVGLRELCFAGKEKG